MTFVVDNSVVPMPTPFGTELSQIILAQCFHLKYLVSWWQNKGIVHQTFYSRLKQTKSCSGLRDGAMNHNTNFLFQLETVPWSLVLERWDMYCTVTQEDSKEWGIFVMHKVCLNKRVKMRYSECVTSWGIRMFKCTVAMRDILEVFRRRGIRESDRWGIWDMTV